MNADDDLTHSRTHLETNSDRCWTHIGVGGDRSCEELAAATHCHNCEVYETAGRSLLERDVPIDYLKEWTAVFAQPQTESRSSLQKTKLQARQAADSFSALIFRLSHEYFALPMSMLQEVTLPMPIHSVPHSHSNALLGLVNIRGRILLCASLNLLLGLTRPATAADPARQKMLVVGSERTWGVLVDEVERIQRFEGSELKAPPIVVSHASNTYTQGVIDWHDKKVNYLDVELLLHSLDRKLL
jgi:chemotaxis-related protein WspD